MNFLDRLFKKRIYNNVHIIFYMHTWCGFCKRMTETLASYQTIYPKAVIRTVDLDKEDLLTDEDRQNISTYNISSVPHLIYSFRGSKKDSVGYMPIEDTMRFIDEAFGTKKKNQKIRLRKK